MGMECKAQLCGTAPTVASPSAPTLQSTAHPFTNPFPVGPPPPTLRPLPSASPTPAGPCAGQQPQRWRRELNRLDHSTQVPNCTSMPRYTLPLLPIHQHSTSNLLTVQVPSSQSQCTKRGTVPSASSPIMTPTLFLHEASM